MKLELFRPLTAIGRAGIAGVALLAGAAAFYLVAGVPLRAEVLALRAEVADARARLTGRLTPAERRDLQLSSFYSYFPQKDSTPLWLGKIYGAAKETGVTLASGEYELQRTKDMR
ncbi:MAG: hypothetical protein IRY96_10805, partial [Burkholderiales bacterium]|nr:hypothetical protein [Burkholderiales bacterium]